MNIHYEYSYKGTNVFEEEFEEELRLDPLERKEIIKSGIVVYMLSNQGLVGESYGLTPAAMKLLGDDDVPDIDYTDDESIYVYSTAIRKKFQGQGFGKQLCEEFASHASNNGYVKLVGHTTSSAMAEIRHQQGAIFRRGAVHHNWFGTPKTARFYTQFLTQNKDYNCGPMALAYLMERKGMTFKVEDLEEILGTNDEYGTSPEAIQKFLRYHDMLFCIPLELGGNSIIDITVNGDGHWIVLNAPYYNEHNPKGFSVYDPLEGIGTLTTEFLEENWASPRYGEKRGFRLV